MPSLFTDEDTSLRFLVHQRGGEFVQSSINWQFTHELPPYTVLPQEIDVAAFAEMLQLYVSAAGRPSSRHYVHDSQEFMRLLNEFSATILAEYSREVREHFLDVPSIVPQRVHDLTHEIVAGLDNDFDRVMAIRDYLLQFPYTLTPVSVPRNVCFVDFFLFEGREGYCTYFASAMAIMSRIAGVPSRYVEGFVLPPPSEQGEPITVTNRMAHAWVEVYLEGFGWHIMEATPTYAILMETDAPVPTSPTTDPAAFESIMDLFDSFQIPEGNRPERPTTPEQPTPTELYEAAPAPVNVPTIVLATLALIALGIAAFIAARSLQEKLHESRIKKLPPNEQLITYFNAVTEIISHYKSPPLPHETIKAYGARYGKRFAFHSDSVFYRDLIAMYYKAKYSANEVTPQEIQLAREAYHDMLILLRATRNDWAYAYLRHVRRVGAIFTCRILSQTHTDTE
jgi:transglutaminase-like putative cysteine protease